MSRSNIKEYRFEFNKPGGGVDHFQTLAVSEEDARTTFAKFNPNAEGVLTFVDGKKVGS